jgi:hypothetical protein
MSSNEADQKPAAATPPVAQALTTEQQAELATQIVVEGVTFQLKGLSVAQALDPVNGLYAKLPDDYKKLADKYTVFAKNYRAAIDIKLPAGMKFEDAWKEYLAAARDAAGKLIEQNKPHLKEMAKLFDPLLPNGGLTGKVLGKGFGTVGDLLSASIDGVDAGLTLPFKLLSASGSAVQDGWRSLATDITEEKAKAFGAAMAGSVYYEAHTRLGKGLGELSLSNPMAALSSGLTYLTTDVPYVSDFWTEVKAVAFYVWEVITHIGKDGPVRPLEEFQKEERAKHAADKGKTFGERLHGHIAQREFPAAAQRMRLAKEVADEPVGSKVDALDGKQGYTNGAGHVVTSNNKGDEKPVTQDGKETSPPLTRPEVVNTRFKEAAAPAIEAWNELGSVGKVVMPVAGVATVVGVGALGVLGVKGAVKGAAEGYRDAPLNRAHTFAEHAEKMAGKAEAPKRWFESTKGAATRVADATNAAQKSVFSMAGELEAHQARGGNVDNIEKAKPSRWERLKHHAKHPAEFVGKLIGRGADELAVTAGAAKDVITKSGERLSAAGKLIPRGPMLLTIAGSAIEDGGSLIGNVANGEGKGALVDVSKMSGAVGGSVAGTITGMNIGGWVGQGLGHAVGLVFGGVGTIPGGVGGRVAGTAVGGFIGGWVGGTATHDVAGATMAAAVDYKPQEIAKTEVKPFTNEELLAMINSQSASVKQKFAAAKAACASADAEAKIKFDDDKRIGFASCKAITMSATK